MAGVRCLRWPTRSWSPRARPLSGAVRVSGGDQERRAEADGRGAARARRHHVRNLHPVADLDVMIDVLRGVGADVEWSGPTSCRSTRTGPLRPEAPYELVRRMRASVNVLGPLARVAAVRRASRCPAATTSAAAARHALPRARGDGRRDRGRARLHRGAGATRSRGTRIVLDFPSVGATENLLTAAVLAKGETVIENAAREPEITDLAAFLNRMGARSDRRGHAHDRRSRASTSSIAADTAIIGDRIEAGTCSWRAASPAARSRIVGVAARAPGDRRGRSSARWACEVSPTPDGVWARADERLAAPSTSRPCRSRASPPTSCRSRRAARGGRRHRHRHRERVRQPARVRRRAHPHGRRRPHTRAAMPWCGVVERLSGAPVRALDVRAGAALVLAGLRGRRRDGGLRPAPRRPRLPRPRRQAPRRSAPTSTGSDEPGPTPSIEAGSGKPSGYWRPGPEDRCPLTPTIDPDDMESGVLEAIDAIRPALQADGGDIVFKRHRRRRRRARRAGGRLRDLPGLDDDAQGRRRADHHGPGAGDHRSPTTPSE